jgi:Ca-activated chloride channel family protein
MTRLLCCLCVLVGLTALPSAQQAPVFRSGSDNVAVYVTVTDKSGRLVPNLTRADFEVRDNGKPQELAVFDNTPQPIRLIVMVDISGSMTRNVPLLRAATTALVQHLGPNDLAKLGTFGEEIQIGPTFTKSAQDLLATFPTTVAPNQPTPLWKAVDQAMTELGTAEGRRVVLVMSDSKDSGPIGKWGSKIVMQPDVIDRANREDVMIYGIGVRSAIQGGFGSAMDALTSTLPDPGLGKVADDTGGGYFELRPRMDLGQVFAQVMDELHHQYLLGFRPPARDGKDHKVEVKVVPKDMKVRARKEYRAPGK